jgi:glyceraldehyde 3-phosphate dehydrogenase
MTIRVGINGFGRIGRTVLRVARRPEHRERIEIVAVNDLFSSDQLAYLLRYDSVMGPYEGSVEAQRDALVVDGRRIALSAQRSPAAIPWREHGVEVAVESTGVFLTREKLEGHLAAGAGKVLLTVPAKDDIDAMIVLGANDEVLRPEHRLVSNASCTTNCLAPLAKVLDEAFGIEQGFMTTVHAYTNDQRLVDAPHKDLRRARAAADNIIPTTTGAARSVGKVLPGLDGKLDGTALRVPVADGSLVDLTVKLRAAPDREAINAALRSAAAGSHRGILEVSDAPLVSSDIVGNPHSSIIDALSTDARGDGFARVVSWYDNEWGYSNRVVDLIDLLGRLAGSH